MSKPIPYNQALPTILPTPTAPGFEVRMNQFVRMFLQIPGTPFATEAAMKLKANWDALIAAVDATKVVFTPLFSASKVPSSKALETGSDSNLTYRGISEYFGEGTSKGELNFRGKDSASMSALSDLSPFSMMNSAGLSRLAAYFVNNDGHIFCNDDFSPILIYNFTVRTRGSEGLNSNDVIPGSFELPPNWDANVIPVIPSFDPRLY